MLGRAAYGAPYILARVDGDIFGDEAPSPSREDIAEQMSAYVKMQFEHGVRPHAITRHMLGLYRAAPGARRWRRFLSENAPAARDDILDQALGAMRAGVAA